MMLEEEEQAKILELIQNEIVTEKNNNTATATATSSILTTATTNATTTTNTIILQNVDDNDKNWWMEKVREKIGTIDDSRMAIPEYASGDISRTFSHISYEDSPDGTNQALLMHRPGSTLGATALIAGTTIGAGILALPAATAPTGFVYSSAALCLAWAYMSMSGLFLAELTLNRMGQTGRQNIGLLELYQSSLTPTLATIGSLAYFFLHYAVMVAYVSQGGHNLGCALTDLGLLSSVPPGAEQVLFVAIVGSFVYAAKPAVVESTNNVLVVAVIATFLGIIGYGATSPDLDLGALVAMENQHPDLVLDCFPICFLSLVYHNIVPTVVTQLEGDRTKITKSILTGTLIPLVMLLGWNAVLLGNIINNPDAMISSVVDPIALLQQEGIGGEHLGQLVAVFSELAVTTSMIGFIYGLLDAWTDLFQLPSAGKRFEKYKPALFAACLLPPLLFSLNNPRLFLEALEYGGAFGVSTLFLVLPPIMVWNQRYGDDQQSLTSPPMVPLGKIPLGSLWKVAGTLILEQGGDKLGVWEALRQAMDQIQF